MAQHEPPDPKSSNQRDRNVIVSNGEAGYDHRYVVSGDARERIVEAVRWAGWDLSSDEELHDFSDMLAEARKRRERRRTSTARRQGAVVVVLSGVVVWFITAIAIPKASAWLATLLPWLKP